MWSPTRSLSGSSPRPTETSTSRSLMIARPGRLLVDDDGCADALLGHHPGRLAQRVPGTDGQNDLRHAFPYFHRRSVSRSPRPARLSRTGLCGSSQPYRMARAEGVGTARATARHIGFAPVMTRPSQGCAHCLPRRRRRRRRSAAATCRRTPTPTTAATCSSSKCGTCHIPHRGRHHRQRSAPTSTPPSPPPATSGMDQRHDRGRRRATRSPTRATTDPDDPTYMPADLVTGQDARRRRRLRRLGRRRARASSPRPRPAGPAARSSPTTAAAAATRSPPRARPAPSARTSTRTCPARTRR